MKRIVALLAVLSTALLLTTPVMAVPTVTITADHLGGGLIQYTLTGNNDTVDPGTLLPGAVAVEVEALSLSVAAFNQIATTVTFAPFLSAPDVDTSSEAAAAAAFDLAWVAAGGPTDDSYWNNSILTTGNPPFSVAPDFNGVSGGAVGSALFQFSAGSAAGTNIIGFPLGQLVVLDPAAAGLALGAQPVALAGFAAVHLLPGSIIAANGASFAVDQTFAVVPEPSTFALLGIGLMALVSLIRRRR